MAKYSLKECNECGKTKSVEEFYPKKYYTKDGEARYTLSHACKECVRSAMRAHAAKPEVVKKKRAVSRKWRKENPGAFTRYWRKNKDKLIPYALARRKRARAPVECREEVQGIYERARKLSEELGMEMHVDHIVPVCMGGQTIPENLQIISKKDNLRKGQKAYSVLEAY